MNTFAHLFYGDLSIIQSGFQNTILAFHTYQLIVQQFA